MKFTHIESNQLFTLSIYVDKQITKANEYFSKQHLDIDSIINYRKALNEHIEASKQQINLLSKQFLRNAHRSITNDV